MNLKINNPVLFALGMICLVVWLGLLLLGRDWVTQIHPTVVLLSPILLMAGLFMLYKATK